MTDEALRRELVGAAGGAHRRRAAARPRVYELQLAGTGPVADLVAGGILKPLNAKLGQACFAVGAVAGERGRRWRSTRSATIRPCSRGSRPIRRPSLYGAPASRQKADRQESGDAEEADDLTGVARAALGHRVARRAAAKELDVLDELVRETLDRLEARPRDVRRQDEIRPRGEPHERMVRAAAVPW